MDRNILLAVTLALSFFAAGCADSGPATQKSGTPAPPATATKETGGLEGVIVNDEQAPIGDAQVSLRLDGGEFKTETQSAQDGSYSFSNLEPGAYVLEVGAFGYESRSMKVQVIADDVVRVAVMLTGLVIEEAVPETIHKRGLINCSVSTPANGGGFYSYNPCRNHPGEASQFPLTIDTKRNATEVILELVWQAGPGGVGQRLQMWLCSDKEDTTNYMNCIQFVGPNPYAVRTQGDSPLVLRRQDLPFKTVSNFEVDVGDGHFEGTSARAPVTFQQTVDLYMTVCYVALCSPDFTAQPPA